MDEDIKQKMERLQQNSKDVLDLSAVLELKLLGFNEQKENMTGFSETFERQKEVLKRLLSETITKREDMESQWKLMVDSGKQDVEKLKEQMNNERQDLQTLKDTMNTEKQELENMRSDIQKQKDILEQAENDIKNQSDELEISKSELQIKMKAANDLFDEINQEKSKLGDLSSHDQSQRQRLEEDMERRNLDQKEIERKNEDLQRQTQELELGRKQIQAECEDLEVLMRSTNQMKEKVEADAAMICKEQEVLNQIKMDNDKDREMLSNERQRLEGEWSLLKMREEQILNTEKSTESLRLKLLHLKERMDEDIKQKMERLQQNSKDVLDLSAVLELKLLSFNDQKENITGFSETFGRQGEVLKRLLSETITQRDNMESQWKLMVDSGKQDVEKLKEQMKKERQDLETLKDTMNTEKQELENMRSDIQKQKDMLEQTENDIKNQSDELEISKSELQIKRKAANDLFDEINQEKSKLGDLSSHVQSQRQRLEDDMERRNLVQKEIERKNEDLQRQTQELELGRKQIQAEREDLEVLIRSTNEMKEKVEADAGMICKEQEVLNQINMDNDKDREMLSNERQRLEGEWSQLKMREEQILNTEMSTENLRLKLLHLKEQMDMDIKQKMDRLQQNSENVLNLSAVLELKLLGFNEQKESMTGFSETFERQKEVLKRLLSETITKRKDIESQWKLMVDSGKQDVEKLKEQMNNERQDLQTLKDTMNTEKQELENMRSEIQKQKDMLEQTENDIKNQSDELEISKSELQIKMKAANDLFDEINQEKSNLGDFRFHVQSQRQRLEDDMERRNLVQKEIERKNQDLQRQTQEIELGRKQIQAEREDLEVLIRSTNEMKEKVEADAGMICKEQEVLNQIKMDNDKDREMLSNERQRLEGEWSQLKMREEQILNTEVSTENLRLKLLHLKERMDMDIKQKMERLQQNSKDVQNLSAVLELKLLGFNEQKESMTGISETFERQGEVLKRLLSETITQRENMESQWKLMVDSGKQDVEKLKEQMNKERQDLQTLKDTMNTEKHELENMRSDIQKQKDMLEIAENDIKNQSGELEISKSELQIKMKAANDLFDEINQEKSNLGDFRFHVQSQRQRLEDDMERRNLVQKEIERKNQDLQRQTQEIELGRKQIQAEREDLEVLIRSTNEMKEKVEADAGMICKEQEVLNQIKMDNDKDREMLSNERQRLEGEWSQLKMREEQILNTEVSTENLRLKLLHLKERMDMDIKQKMERLQQNSKDIQNLSAVLELKLLGFNEQKESMTGISETFERQGEVLKRLLSETITQRENMESQWKLMVDSGKQDVEKLKEQMNKERQDLQTLKDTMNTEKHELENMRSDIQKQKDMLEIAENDIKNQSGELEISKSELQIKMKAANDLFDEINQEKSNLGDFRFHVQSQRQRLEDDMERRNLVQKEIERKNQDLQRQTQEIELG
ncbi:kinesin-like protein KIF20B [Cololabis saira]|uniref:kinesin-like protein KIF20B n=1 Tax=Cololabis saira TaxID=129043 RepID=UPI002AD39F37|nr:kinesin-like protein KIF20B [Cololabis saira]